MAAKRKIVDREKLELDFRAGIKTYREMSALHGLSPARIKQIADEEGWPRDLAVKIQQVAEAKLNKSILNANLNAEARKASETEVVNASADQVVAVRLSQRTRIARAGNIVAALFDELQEDTDLRANPVSVDPLNPDAPLKQPLALNTRAGIAKSLADSLKTVITLEREAYGINADMELEDPLSVLLRSIKARTVMPVADDPDIES